MKPIITVNQLTKKYGSRTAVDNLSFSLSPGQILGLLGPNGAGKTTTMRMLMGLSKPTSGTITIFGYNSRIALQEIHHQIGVVFEKPNLIESLSAYHNLALFCKLYNAPLSRIQPLLEQVDLGSRAREPVKNFSKGMKQRLLIIRALIHQPRLLFLDEPASGLDPVSAKIIWDYLKEQTALGTTIILTSHDMQEVDELCDTIGFINQGRLIALEKTHLLKAQFGQMSLQVTFQEEQGIVTKSFDPTPEHFEEIQKLYATNRVISIRSMEASLSEIFHTLSRVE